MTFAPVLPSSISYRVACHSSIGETFNTIKDPTWSPFLYVHCGFMRFLCFTKANILKGLGKLEQFFSIDNLSIY